MANVIEPFDNMDSEKRAIVVGASSGIGHATAIALAEAGWDVLVHGFRKVKQTHDLADRIRSMGRRSEAMIADLADPQAVQRLTEEAWEIWGGLESWLHLAGSDILTGEARHAGFEAKLHMLWSVDVLSTISACRLVGRLMEEQGHGAIVTMGWDQAETGMDGDSGELFATTKGAVMAFTRSLAMSLAPKVRVNAVAPGWIRTAWGDVAPKAWQERVLRETPMARWGTPEDVARACVFLASDQSEFLTGQAIRVNGGAVR